MAANHIPRPRRIALTVRGARINVFREQAKIIGHADLDGWITPDVNEPSQRTITNMMNRGWLIRTRGRLRLTPKGLEVRAALVAYQARKQDALNGGTR
jgi:hypothetical protein